MERLYLDFESYWADDFTLTKMTPVEYIQSPRFETLGCGFAFGETQAPFWLDGPELPRFFKDVDWASTYAVSHNALFDMLILSLHYGVFPGGYGCTLSMARNWLSHRLSSLSLEKISEHYGLPPKWGTAQKFKNLNLRAIKAQPDLYKEMCEYGVDDVVKCRTIFLKMIAEGFPGGEFPVIDMVVRMAAVPQFELDQTVLAEHLAKVQADKQALLDACFMDKADIKSIMSDQQLMVKLLMLGVDPIPTKVSKTTGKTQYAFAKTDKEFKALLEHDKPMVQALVAARLGHKSTLEETRTERMLAVARATDKFPIPLKYSGAHTHRFSGDWKLNVQNYPRGGELRRSLKAPPGKKVVAVDASQIEARFNAELSGEVKLLDAFREGRDVYSEFAVQIYGYENFPKQSKERFVGKTAILSLGYGSSWPVFQAMCRNTGNVILTDNEATRIVSLYRTMFPNIVHNWSVANNQILPRLAQGRSQIDDIAKQMGQEHAGTWGPLKLFPHAIELPNKNRLRYFNLHQEVVDGYLEYRYERGRFDHKIYGAKLVENVIQALAFVAIMEAAIRIKQATGGDVMPVHQVHDELIFLPDERDAIPVMELAIYEMSRSPVWMPNVPLAAEGHIGATYYDAK